MLAIDTLASTMNTEEIRDYCLTIPGVTEAFAFGGDTLVYRS